MVIVLTGQKTDMVILPTGQMTDMVILPTGQMTDMVILLTVQKTDMGVVPGCTDRSKDRHGHFTDTQKTAKDTIPVQYPYTHTSSLNLHGFCVSV